MRRRHKAGLFRNVRNALVRLLNEVLRSLDTHAVDILDEREVDGLLEKAAQIIRADIELTGNAGQGQLLGVVLGNISLDLIHNVVADAAILATLLLLLAAEVLEFQQKRSQQHLAQCIGFRGGFLLQGQQLLQQALDVVLLLDCDI